MTILILNIFTIIFSIIYIIDISGFSWTLNKIIFHILHYKDKDAIYLGQQYKPFSCSICLVFWLTFLYLIFNISFFLSLFIASLSSFLVPFFKMILKKIYNKWTNL